MDISLNKFGGAGDVGDPSPIGHTGIGWQPVLQGSMGYADDKNTFISGPLNQDISDDKTLRHPVRRRRALLVQRRL